MKFSYEDPENQEEKVYEEFGVTKDDCLGAFFFNKMEGLMFEYEWVSEEVAADIGNNIIKHCCEFKYLLRPMMRLYIPDLKYMLPRCSFP